jgi:hypothetical protein
MDKARRRFANLQQELGKVNPSERKYKVKNRQKGSLNVVAKKLFAWVFVGDSKSDHSRV